MWQFTPTSLYEKLKVILKTGNIDDVRDHEAAIFGDVRGRGDVRRSHEFENYPIWS